MRLMTFSAEGAGTGRVGLLEGDRVHDLTARHQVRSVKQLISMGLPRLDTGEADYHLDEITPDLPITQPGKIICVGVNYMRPDDPYRTGAGAPEYPALFMRAPHSLSPHEGQIWRPPESEQFDYEGEIVLVIGEAGRRIPAEQAHRHIAGLTIMNEGSVRDWMRHGQLNITQGKNFERSGGLGPWIETDLSTLDLADLTIETQVNGELRQQDTTANMIFPIGRIIEYVSTYTALHPGDLIATGTPKGQGQSFDPPKWLVPGDVVEVTLQGVGSLRNHVVDEPGAPPLP